MFLTAQTNCANLIRNSGFNWNGNGTTTTKSGGLYGNTTYTVQTQAYGQGNVSDWYESQEHPDAFIGEGINGTDCLFLLCGFNPSPPREEAAGQTLTNSLISGNQYIITFYARKTIEGSGNLRIRFSNNVNFTGNFQDLPIQTIAVTEIDLFSYYTVCFTASSNWTDVQLTNFVNGATAENGVASGIMLDEFEMYSFNNNDIALTLTNNSNSNIGSICTNDSFTISETCFSTIPNSPFTFQWLERIGTNFVPLNGQTNATLTLTRPAGNHTFQLQISNGNNCTISRNITFTVFNPQPISITSASSICQGMPVTLTATPTGFTSYNWTIGSSIISIGASSSLTHTPTGTTTYNLAVTDDNGCRNNASKTVTVLPAPTISISEPVTICPGQTHTITATSNTIFLQWFLNGTLLSINGQLTVSPQTTTTYTIVATANGCTTTQTHTVTVDIDCPCNPAAVNEVLGNISSPNNNPVVHSNKIFMVAENNTITFNGPITFNNCEFRMGTNSQIRIINGLTTFKGCHLYACDQMWQGIKVEQKGRLSLEPHIVNNSIRNTTLIEDARKGVYIINVNEPLVLNVNNSTFNKNEIGIELESITQINPEVNFSIYNSVFTCRNIPFTPATVGNTNSITWPKTNDIKGVTITNDIPGSNIAEYIYSATGPLARLKAPLQNTLAKIGINLISVGRVSNFPNSTYQSMVIGNTLNNQYNLFDNMSYGIYANTANVVINNAVFQYFTQKGAIAVYTTSTISSPITTNDMRFKNLLRINPGTNGNTRTKFYNCNTAVESEKYFEVFVDKIIVKHYATNNIGRNGVIVNTSFFKNVRVTNSNFVNLNVGIQFTGTNNSGFIALNGNRTHVSGTIQIFGNELKDNLNNNAVAGRYLKNAIVVQNTGDFANNSTFYFPGSSINVTQNTIKNAFRGIDVKNFTRNVLYLNENDITLKQEALTSEQFGISNTFNRNASNVKSKINNNKVVGFGHNINPLQKAIFTNSCSNQFVMCNDVSTSYNGIQFDQENNNINFELNKMGKHFYGFVLNSNGVIGTQGFSTNQTYRTGNIWQNGFTFKTATFNSSAQNSIMYVGSANLENPDGDGFNNLSEDDFTYSTSAVPPTLIVLGLGGVDSPNILECGTESGFPTEEETESEISQGELNKLRVELEKIARGEKEYIDRPIQSKIKDELKAYRELKKHPILLEQSADLALFYQEAQNSSKEQITKVEHEIEQGNYENALLENASLNQENPLDEQYQAFYDLYLKQSLDTNWTETDSLNLLNIANACPADFGAVVYHARALFQAKYLYSEAFKNTCETFRTDNSQLQTSAFKEAMIKLYPNPSKGDFEIEKKSNGIVFNYSIYDLSGKHLEQHIGSELIIDQIRTKLSKGIYLLEVFNTQTHEKEMHQIHIID